MLKSKNPLKIISIIPGSRYLGFAIFSNVDLRDWGIKNIKANIERTEKIKNIFSSYISKFHPQVLAIKKLNPIRSAEKLQNIVKQLIIIAKQKGLTIYQCTLEELKLSISPKERINKNELSKKIASEYPVLSSDLKKEEKNKNHYYQKEFAAVILGSNCFNQLDKKIN